MKTIDPGVLYAKVRLSFLKGACCFGNTPDEEVVAKKIEKICLAETKNLLNYAHIAGRNWAIEDRRRRESAARRALKQEHMLLQQAKEEAHEDAMKQEMYDLQQRVFYDPARKPGEWWREQLALILISDNLPTGKWGEYFTGQSMANLYQIRCRAIKFVKGRYPLSDELVKWIDDRKRTVK